MPPLESARLTERVTIQSPAPNQDSIGEPVPTWTTFAEVWARLSDINGREYVAAKATQNEAQTRIQIRYIEGVLPKMRAVHNGTVYHIDAVLGQDRVELTLMCRRLEA